MAAETTFATPLGPNPPAATWLTSRPRPALLGVLGVLAALAIGALGATKPTYGIALVAAAGVAAMVLVRPFFGGLVLVGLVPVISGLAPGIPVPGVRASEALIGLVGVTILVATRRRDALPWGALDWLVLAYGVAWLVFAVYNASVLGEHLSLSTWGSALGQLQFFLLYRGARLSIRTPKERRLAVKVMAAASVPVSILAILQQLKVPVVTSLLASITVAPGQQGGFASSSLSVSQVGVSAASFGGISRASGPFDDWTSLAGYLFLILLLVVALALAGEIRRRRAAAALLALLALIGLFLTAELSAIAGLVVGVAVLGVQFRRGKVVGRWMVAGALVVAVLVGSFMFQRLSQEFSASAGSVRSQAVPQTLGYRQEVWTGQYFPAIAARPLTGYGLALPPQIQWPYTESQYVTLLMEGGAPVLLLFCAMTWATVRRGRATARSPDPFDQAVGRALVVAVLALVVMDVIWPYMSNGGLPQILWSLAAVASPLPAAAALDRQRPAPDRLRTAGP